MTRILLTGADGQLGWELARRARAADVSCYALGKRELDITVRDAVFRAVAHFRPAVVVNAASYTKVDQAEAQIATAFSVNTDGAANMAQACAAAKIPLIHVSTDYVFDGSKRAPYIEDDTASPLCVYGRSKWAGEEAVRDCCSQHLILRTAWLYGAHGRNFVKTMLRLGKEGNTIQVVDDQTGSPTFAGDLASAILVLIKRLNRTTWPYEGFGTFHCVGQGTATWYEFARAVFEYARPQSCSLPNLKPLKTAEYPMIAKRPAYSVLACSRLAKVHGVVMRPWKLGLAEMLDLQGALANPMANMNWE